MTEPSREDRRAAVALAFLRTSLLVVIFVNEQLVDARQLADWPFFVVLSLASVYALGGVLDAFRSSDASGARALARMHPLVDVVLLGALAYTSGGAYSDVRKAFFVIPLAAAFSERARSTASWSAFAVVTFTLQAVAAGGHPA